ncbi:MAG: flagellar protein FliS [Ignavibacteriaceae bacterium]|jgi:flagellar protein FliS|nr:flagellar protein FliS [Ignavibacteriaceae bacterium]
MQHSALANNNSNRMNQYLVKEILEATPQQLLIKVYDFAIVNCNKHNMVKTNNAIQELINSLNFETESVREISTGLLRLYLFCQEQMRLQKYDTVNTILVELRSTWVEAFRKL